MNFSEYWRSYSLILLNQKPELKLTIESLLGTENACLKTLLYYSLDNRLY